METQSTLINQDKQMKATVEFKLPATSPESESQTAANAQSDCCKNGVCSLNWKPQRPAAA